MIKKARDLIMLGDKIKLALTDEIAEVQKITRARKITVSNGIKMGSKPGEFIYFFPCKENIAFDDECPIQVDCGGQTANGSIVSIKEDQVILSLSEDFGERIHAATLSSQQSYLLENLKEKLTEKLTSENLDQAIFREVLATKGRSSPALAFDSKSRLNQEQKVAVGHSLSNPVTFIWGPPGTGKTHSLAEIIYQTQKQNKSILVVSNTNRALDVLVLKLCQLIKNEPYFLQGQAIRIGNIVHEDLEEHFSDFIAPQKIADRLNQSLDSDKQHCKARISALVSQLNKIEPIIDLFDSYKRIKQELTDIDQQKNTQLEKKVYQEAEKKALLVKIIDLENDLKHPSTGLKVKNILGIKTFEAIEKNIESESRKLFNLDQDIADHTNNIERLKILQKQKESEYKILKGKILELVPSGNVSAEIGEIDRIKKDIVTEEKRIKEIDSLLNDTINKIYANAKIIAATATKVHLDKYLNRKFDMVVLDEASMLNLPLSLYCCLHAHSKIVIAGDFRQIPPIYFNQKSENVKDYYAKNIFSFSGIEQLVNQGKIGKQLIQLRSQYRMQRDICELINHPVYGGSLITETAPVKRSMTSQLLSKPVTIVDTSADNPYSNYKPRTNSRYNLLNACTIISILEKVSKDVELEDIGVITAFKAQADLINRMLENTPYQKVACGTIHKFQGSEKKVIVLDITDSIGTPKSKYIQANSLDDDGVKLYNVALSRAKDNLIIIGNLYFLYDKVGNGFMSNVLAEATAFATAIPSHTLFNITTYENAVRETYSHKANLPESNELVFVDEEDFSNVFPTDLLNAQQFVTIFSPFCTIKRVAFLGDILRTLIKKNVKVRVVTRPPYQHGSIPQTQVSEAINELIQMGTVVDLRSNMHEKICIIDGQILWSGSLNILSFAHRSDEMMIRMAGENICRAMAELQHFRFRDKKPLSIAQLVAEQENDNCNLCQSNMVLIPKGKNGIPYFKCLSCDKSQPLDQPLRKQQPRLLTYARSTFPKENEEYHQSVPANAVGSEEKICNLCRQSMRLINGKYGWFWGCVSYPKCKNTESCGTR